VLNRLASYSRSFTQYHGYTVQELFGIAYRFRYDLDEDAQEFLEKLDRWKAIDLKRRQIRWLAGLARMFEPIGRDDLDYVEEEAPTSEAADLTGPNMLESARYYPYRAVRTL
jgi:glycyl-tRNA synthetase (class II)